MRLFVGQMPDMQTKCAGFGAGYSELYGLLVKQGEVPRINLLLSGAFTGLFIFGLIFNIMGPALPFIVGDLDLTLAGAGTLYSLRGLGVILSVFLSGVLADIFGKKVVILSGVGLWIVGLAIFAFSTSTYLSLAIWVLIGLGLGAVDAGINSLVAEVSANKASAMSRLHFWFGVGAVTAPLYAQWMLSIFSWRILFLSVSLMALVFFAFIAGRTFPANAASSGQSVWSNLRLVVNRTTLFLGVIMFGYTGIGTAFMGWINTYLNSHLFVSPWAASIVLTIYSLGLSVGRLAISEIAERVKYERLLIVSAVLSTLTTVLALSSGSAIVAGLGFGLTGFFFAALLPTCLAIGTGQNPHLAGTVTGLLITFGAVGRTIVPGLVGSIANSASIARGMQILLVFSGLIVVAALVLNVNKSTKGGASRDSLRSV